MSLLTYHAHALGPLRNVTWTPPEGVSLVVGPNRVGKSTLLRLPEFIRRAVHWDLETAVNEIFKGSAYLRRFGATPEEVTSVGLAEGLFRWRVEIVPFAGTVRARPTETLSIDADAAVTRRQGADEVLIDGESIHCGARLLPRACLDQFDRDIRDDTAREVALTDPRSFWGKKRHSHAAVLLAIFAKHCAAYRTYEFATTHLLQFGAQQSPDLMLHPSGDNVFPLLRNWRDRSDYEERFDFVLATIREAFPHVHKFNFEQAGQTVTMSIVDSRWKDRPTPIAYESTGLLAAILQLCGVASAEENGIVTLDEMETSLHPHAIRVLIAAFRRWAEIRKLRIVLATQSETVLDQFRDEPEKIFVIEPKQEVSPQPLTELFGAEWLSQFSLGDLFSHLEFGAPDRRE